MAEKELVAVIHWRALRRRSGWGHRYVGRPWRPIIPR